VRQVGKTYAVRQLGQQFENFIELNLEKSAKGRKFFQADLDPHEIIQEISHLFKQQIVPGKTLLFLDEVQAEVDYVTNIKQVIVPNEKIHSYPLYAIFMAGQSGIKF
jgi:hypothetical protein